MTGDSRRAEMFLDLADDPREIRTRPDTERATLVEYLRGQRLTLELKCSGLDAAAMAQRAVPPSTLSLLGLVRHLADVERGWMRESLSGLDAPPHFSSPSEPDGDFDGAVPDAVVVAEAWRVGREECAFTDRFVSDAPDLGVTGPEPDRRHPSLRAVLVHLVEEYARHNGHADLLRERIDGRVGL